MVFFWNGKNKLKTEPNTVATAETLNRMRTLLFYEELKKATMASIQWDTDLDTIDTEYIEKMLFEKGFVFFFKDEVYLCLEGTYDKFNVYGRPSHMTAIGYNGRYRNSRLTYKNCVPIFNNQEQTSTSFLCMEYAKILADITRSIDVNLDVVKTVPLILCNDDVRLSVQNAYAERRKNVPAIFGKKNFDKEFKAELINPDPLKNYVSDKLQELFTMKWNEYFTFIGIPNVTVQKKERMISDEVNRMQGGVLAFADARMIMREKAAKQIKNMFGEKMNPYMPTHDKMNKPYDLTNLSSDLSNMMQRRREDGILHNDTKNHTGQYGDSAGSNTPSQD